MATLLAALYLAAGTQFCEGIRFNGDTYQEFIQEAQAGYKNEPNWSREVRNGQKALCGEASF